MRLPSIIIASAGNGYQVLYKSKAFDSLNPADFNAMCERMDGARFDGENAYIVTQSLGKIVLGKSTMVSKPEFGDIKIKVTHCYFMNMTSFIDIVRGYRKQGAVIATFKEQIRQDYDESVETVSFVKKNFPEQSLSSEDIVDSIISFGMTDAYKKFMFTDINSEDALKVLFGFFPATFISELSVLSAGEAVSNDYNVLFGAFNAISDNRIISVHAASKNIASINAEIEYLVMSSFKNYIIDIMEHSDKNENGYLAELVSVIRIVSDFERTSKISATQVIKLMDKASTIEGKMSIYGLVIEMRNNMNEAEIINTEMLEKYWAFVVYTSVVNNDKKNAALVHNVCTNQKGIDRERYYEFIREAIIIKQNETNSEALAILILISFERQMDKTKLINSRYDFRRAHAFIVNKLNIGARGEEVERLMFDMTE